MATPKRVHGSGGIPFQIDPSVLPDDGSSVTFEQTFAKKLGSVGPQQNMLTEEDFENSEWSVDKLGPRGPQNIATVRGRPFAHTLRRYGPGQYVATPLDKQGKPVESLQRDILVGNPLDEEEASTAAPTKPHEGDNMPPWMQLMLQQQAEERAEQRRREAESKREREAWEREQSLKEEARKEREERLREMQMERESQARKEAAERNNALLMAGMQMAQQVGSALIGVMTAKANTPPAPPPARDDRLQELLLQHVLTDRSKPSGGLKESLDLLIVLDQVAQSRADRLPASTPEEKEEDMGSTMMKMLPMLLASRMGGGSPAAGGAPAALPDVEGLLSHALNDPAIIAKVAARNPEAVARTFSKVVKSDPKIEAAVVKVLEEDE